MRTSVGPVETRLGPALIQHHAGARRARSRSCSCPLPPTRSRTTPTPLRTRTTASGSACCCSRASPVRRPRCVPWGRALAATGLGVAVPRLPGHGTTWQELEPDALGRLVRRGRPVLREAARQLRPGRRRRPVDGGRPGAAARRRPRPRGRRDRAGEPRGQHRAQGRARAAGAQARGAGVPRHRQRHQEARRRGVRLHQDAAAGRALDDDRLEGAARATSPRSPSRC